MLRNFIMSFIGAMLGSGITIILLNNIFKFKKKSRKSLDYTKDKNLPKERGK